MTMTPEGVALMAQYNQWMNANLYGAAAKLSDAELAADKGAFFGSILGTLNHIAAADLIWLSRFSRHMAGSSAPLDMSEFPRPAAVREAIGADLASLRSLRTRLDEHVVQWVAKLTEAHMASDMSYTNLAGEASLRNLGALLMHFFNHETHHRGQVTTLLFQSGIDMGVTDLAAIIPNKI